MYLDSTSQDGSPSQTRTASASLLTDIRSRRGHRRQQQAPAFAEDRYAREVAENNVAHGSDAWFHYSVIPPPPNRW